MAAFYDALEIRSPDQREAEQSALLSRQVAHAKERAPYFRDLLAAVDPGEVTNRSTLARLPVTRKSALIALQERARPFGGMIAGDLGALARVFMSPGPIAEP